MSKFQFRLVAALVGCSVVATETPSHAQYTQNFNTLANTGTSASVPAGWAFNETGTNADGLYAAGNGISGTGNVYSFGSTGSTDRAFGGLRGANLVPTIGVHLQNQTASTFTSLNITYFGEQWHLGVVGQQDRLDFQYSLSANSITDTGATWVDFNALDFASPNTTTAGALDGNAAGNRTQLTGTITGLSLNTGDTIWFRWMDFDLPDLEDGLGVDDFTVSQSLTAAPVPEPASILAVAAGALGLGGYVRRRRARQSSAVE